MKIARIGADLGAKVSADSSCSVLWLVPDEAPEELDEAFSGIIAQVDLAAWGFVGLWDQSTVLASQAEEIARISTNKASLSFGPTKMEAHAIAISALNNRWFWPLFISRLRAHQICAALMPDAADTPTGWTYAALQLVLAEAARQVRPGRATHKYVVDSLLQAFLAESLLANGMAVSRLQASILPPGVALTASDDLIDAVQGSLSSAEPLDQRAVDRCIYLSGPW